MGQYTSYYLYQKYEQREGQDPIPCIPSIYSVDADGTMEKVIKLENDPDCGYTPPPSDPIYRWYQIPITEDYICASCGTPPIYRWLKSDDTVCVENSPTPTGETIYRWVACGTTCVGYDKWQRSIQQYSEDNGTTWYNTNPPVYSATSLIESDSEDCGYIPPTPTGGTKWIATYNFEGNIRTLSAECDSSGELVSGEISAFFLVSVEVGACVTRIQGDSLYCSTITDITIDNTTPPIIDNNAFHSALQAIYVPSSSVETYKAASVWRNYASIIQAIP